MALTIFSTELDGLCRRKLLQNQSRELDANQFQLAMLIELSRLFEQLMLFEKVIFKVQAENVILPVFIRAIGPKDLEALLEQNAIGFSLWTPLVTYMPRPPVGIHPLQSGNTDLDPGRSIELAYQWLPELTAPARRALKGKLIRAYDVPETALPREVVARTLAAYSTGKLKGLGLPADKTFDELTVSDRELLCSCASQTLEYQYMVSRGLSGYSNLRQFSLLQGTANKIKSADCLSVNFQTLTTIEGLPDFRAMSLKMHSPFEVLVKHRMTRNAAKFREWLTSVTYSTDAAPIAKEYVDAITEAKGFFETGGGKFIKSIAMTCVGSTIGAAAGAEGAAIGGLVGKLSEPLADWALDLVDEFVLNGLLKGWTPKMFFDDLTKLSDTAR